MLILESLFFPHCSSYPSDSLKAHLYSFSKTKQNPTTFGMSPVCENLE